MTSYVTPKKGVQFIFYAGLPSVASTDIFQSNPTIASGDFKVSIDGGALANLATLPAVTPASSKMVKFTLSTSEMNGDNITVIGSDAAGGEWKDILVNIQTSARQIDDLAYPATSGRSMVVDANGLVDANTVKIGPTGSGTAQTARDVGASVLLSSGTGTGQLDFTSGVVKANVTQASGTAIQASGGYFLTHDILNVTTIATLASQTSFTLTAGSADNSAYVGCECIVLDASTAVQKAIGVISAYTGSTKTVTLRTDPGVFTMATSDIVAIRACKALQPTVDGRTLDVSSGGEAGVDWANVGSPTTTVGLSGTTVKTATDVETDTQDIQSRIPAALSSGNMKVDVFAMQAGTVTAAAIATDAIDADALKADAATEIATAVLTSAMTESYAADGVAPTLAQAIFLTMQSLSEFAISGTTITVKKLDGSTTAATFTLDDATTPTSRTRAT